MDLKSYVEAERGRSAALARDLGITPVMVSQWANGVKAVPAERCPAIERATGGAVRCEELRPDVAWGVLREQAAPEATVTKLDEPSEAPAAADFQDTDSHGEPHTPISMGVDLRERDREHEELRIKRAKARIGSDKPGACNRESKPR